MTASRHTGLEAQGSTPATPKGRVQLVAGALNHLGVEVVSSEQGSAAAQRLTRQCRSTLTQDATSCCFAVQDKVWVHDPDGAAREVYTVLADAPDATIGGSSACSTVEGPCVPADDGATGSGCCGDAGTAGSAGCGCS